MKWKAIGFAALLSLAGALNGADAREQVLSVTVNDLEGRQQPILVRVCRPNTNAPARLVVINHGSSAAAAERAKAKLKSCGGETAQWFLRRGFVVAFPLRRGYGRTGGHYAEGYGACSHAAYGRAGLATAEDIDAAIDAVTALPYVQPNRVVVAGLSAGAWGALAYDSVAHPHVSAFVVMAAGRGGHVGNIPANNCRPDLLAEAARRYGRTARTPSLWVYAANDTFFGPSIATSLHDAFTASGGVSEFVQTGPFGPEGHVLFLSNGGSAVWGPLVDRFLATNGCAPDPPGYTDAHWSERKRLPWSALSWP